MVDKETRLQDGKFKPGVSGNPKGRPKSNTSITDGMKEEFTLYPKKKLLLLQRILKQALAGDTPSPKLIWSYMAGRPQQTIQADVSGKVTFFLPKRRRPQAIDGEIVDKPALEG